MPGSDLGPGRGTGHLITVRRLVGVMVQRRSHDGLTCGEVMTVAKGRKTSAKAAKAASKVLRDGRTGKASKTAAGSALSQRAPRRKK